MPTTLTSAIGATPTMSNAARTFCQKRIRGRRILPLPCPTRLLFVLLPARLAASSADSVSGPSHRTASVRTRNVLVRGFISKSERAQRPSGRTGYARKEASRRQSFRLYPDGGRLGHLLPPLAGGRGRLRHAPRRTKRVLREGHGSPPRQAAGGEGHSRLSPRRKRGTAHAAAPGIT